MAPVRCGMPALHHDLRIERMVNFRPKLLATSPQLAMKFHGVTFTGTVHGTARTCVRSLRFSASRGGEGSCRLPGSRRWSSCWSSCCWVGLGPSCQPCCRPCQCCELDAGELQVRRDHDITKGHATATLDNQHCSSPNCLGHKLFVERITTIYCYAITCQRLFKLNL